MKNLIYLLLLIFTSCNNGNITLREAREKDSLTNTDLNKILRKEHDLAMEGIRLLQTASEDTAAKRRVLLINNEIEEWRDLVKEKVSKDFIPSAEQTKMLDKVREFKNEFNSFR